MSTKLLKLFIILVFALKTTDAFPQHRSVDEAQAIANSFLSKQNGAQSLGAQRRSKLRVVNSAADILNAPSSADAPFYVFSSGDSSTPGFVIVSGDERMADVLAYSDEGVFDADNLPTALVHLLGQYEQEWKALDGAHSNVAYLPKRAKAFRAKARNEGSLDGSFLLRTTWGQKNPYNLKCPDDGDAKSLTGCIAVTSAQVMAYYGYPQYGMGSVDYVTETKGIRVRYNFTGNRFEWDRLLENYTGSYSEGQANAIAHLMAACGAACFVDYGKDGTSGTSLKQMHGLSKYMLYDKDMALIERDYMSEYEWQYAIFNELENGRPVICSALSGNDGHSFIVDGYRFEGGDHPLYHVNWGWAGLADGFFLMTALNPETSTSYHFNRKLDAIIGMQPDNDKTDIDSYWQGESATIAPDVFVRGTVTGVDVKLNRTFNHHNNTFRGKFLFYLVNEEGEETYVGSKSISDAETYQGFSSLSANFYVPEDLPEGEYLFCVKSLSSDGTEPQYMTFGSELPVLTIVEKGSANPVYLADIQSTDIKLNSATPDGNVSMTFSKPINMRDFSFTGGIRMGLVDEAGEVKSMFGQTYTINDLKYLNYKNTDVSLTGALPVSTVADGHYRLCLLANQSGYEGWSPLRQYTIVGNMISSSDVDVFFDVWVYQGELLLTAPIIPPTVYTLTYMVDNEVYKVVQHIADDKIEAEKAPSKEGYTFSGWSEIPSVMPAHDVVVTGSFKVNTYTLTYKLNGETYKTVTYNYGATVIEDKPEGREGCTFTGWKDIPTTMPSHDVVVNGVFEANSYTISYKVGDEVYSTVSVKYGEPVPVAEFPVKEGHTFSGWGELPKVMPAHDVAVYGTFEVNTYTLKYIVDGEAYYEAKVLYGEDVRAESAPVKEGYAFSGWNGLPATMPAHDVEVTGSFTISEYTITYIVDGEVYKTFKYTYGESVTPEPKPTREGYDFYGWSEIPATMPAHDVEVSGSFANSIFTLTYVLEGKEYKTVTHILGDAIVPEEVATREGYSFTGWEGLPSSMPAHDLTVTGSYVINHYNVIYKLGREEYKVVSYAYNESVTKESSPVREGCTFLGWSEIPSVMPAHDVVVTGSFLVNTYTLSYQIDGKKYKSASYRFGEQVMAEGSPSPREGYTFSGWSEIPSSMPAHDVVVKGSFLVNSYTIIYMYNDVEVNRVTLDYGAAIPAYEYQLDPTDRYTYTFVGWMQDGKVFDLSAMPATDIILEADIAIADGIGALPAAVSVRQGIYTLSGTLVSKTASADDIRKLKDGIYIINGRKYAIKH